MGNKYKKKEKQARIRQIARMIAQSQCFIFIARFWGNNKQVVYLQQLNRLFYRRVAQWVWTVYRKPTIRLSNIVCSHPYSTEKFLFPTQAMIDKMLESGSPYRLFGFKNNYKDGSVVLKLDHQRKIMLVQGKSKEIGLIN